MPVRAKNMQSNCKYVESNASTLIKGDRNTLWSALIPSNTVSVREWIGDSLRKVLWTLDRSVTQAGDLGWSLGRDRPVTQTGDLGWSPGRDMS